MAHLITFLSAASSVRLAKTITFDKVKPYPLVKNVNSFTFETDGTPEGLAQRLEIYREHAGYGYALHKGAINRQLKNESRRGSSDSGALTNTLIIDVDGWKTEIDMSAPDHQTVEQVAEEFVALLPEEFQNVSYIVHASASFGMKKGQASVHIEFLLANEMSPRALKDYMFHLNLNIPEIEAKLEMTKSGHALSWILDPSVVDNSKIIYIAPPIFEGATNPFKDDAERWSIVTKSNTLLDIQTAVGEVNPTKTDSDKKKKLRTLRKALGLPIAELKTSRINIAGNDISIIAKPNSMRLELYDISGEFAIFNVNGGDSHAYWCRMDSPDIIYNFKGETPFQFSKADPEGYEVFTEQYADQLTQANPRKTEVFYDRKTGRYYIVQLDMNTGRVAQNAKGSQEFYDYDKGDIENELANRGIPKPDIIPSFTMEFMPQVDVIIDKTHEIFNRFMPTEYMKSPPEIDDVYKEIRYERGKDNQISALLRSLCPNIHKIIWHLLGNDNESYEHFINWLAYSYQERRVSTTAWVITGVQGTGKGVFFTKVLQKIWGVEYADVLKIDNFEDAYDGNLANKLLICLDEIHMGDSSNPSKALDRLKSLTGNEINSFRHMRQERMQLPCYFNFLVFSNHIDAMLIESGDRRFNVSPPQMTKLAIKHPELNNVADKLVEPEIGLFAAFLRYFECDHVQARTALENEAKRNMQTRSSTSVMQFFQALKFGDLEYFVQYVLEVQANPLDIKESHRLDNAKLVVKKWVKDCTDEISTEISTNEMRLVYLALYPEKDISPSKFSSMLSKNGVETKRIRDENNIRFSGITATFFLTEERTPDIVQKLMQFDPRAVH